MAAVGAGLTLACEVPAFLAGVPKDRIVHFKGFGVGKLLSREYDAAILAELSEAIGDDGVIVWDGDEFADTSFTRVLDAFLRASSVRAVAFYFRCMQAAFTESWEVRSRTYQGGLNLVLLDDGPERPVGGERGWLELGRAALRLSGARRVLAAGGGGVAAAEAAACAEALPPVHWTLLQLPRAGDASDFGSLHACAVREDWRHVEIRVYDAELGRFVPRREELGRFVPPCEEGQAPEPTAASDR